MRFDRLAIAALPYVPGPVMRRLASRYIAGETLDEALAKLRELSGQGFRGIVDILGEDVEREEGARRVAELYCKAVDTLAESGLEAYVSVKPTHIGLRISEDLAFELYARIARRCRERGSFVRVEMEDHTTTDATLRVFERLRAEFDCVGIVLQSRLFRTPADVDALAAGPLSVRMVKGIYLEPAAIAHVDPEPIRDAYFELCRKLFDRGAYVSFATHDESLADRLLSHCKKRGIGTDRYEFQVLLGVRQRLWQEWLADGHPVRVYVPYGPEWRPYSIRRLRHNPDIFRHVLRDLMSLNGRR